MQKKPSILAKGLILLLIICAIGGLWFIKNTDSVFHKSAPSPTPIDNSVADFSLESPTVIDFQAMSAFGLPMIIDYGSDSCIPCKAMAPVLEKLNAEMTGKALSDLWTCGNTLMQPAMYPFR